MARGAENPPEPQTPKNTEGGRENYPLMIFYYIEHLSRRFNQKINFGKQIERDYIGYPTITDELTNTNERTAVNI